jgi:hypothetical protein
LAFVVAAGADCQEPSWMGLRLGLQALSDRDVSTCLTPQIDKVMSDVLLRTGSIC